MTANLASDIENLSISNHNETNANSKPSSQSQSHPNLQQINDKNKEIVDHKANPIESKANDTNTNNNDSNNNMNNNNNNNEDSNAAPASYTGLAYGYAASAASGAYGYMASFYPSSSAQPQSQSSSQSPPHQTRQIHSQSLSSIEHKKQMNGIHPSHGQNGQNGQYTAAQLEQQQKLQRQQSTYDASKPDPIKYPITNNATDASNSNLGELVKFAETNGINVGWAKKLSQPSPDKVQLRSLTYKVDGKKQVSAGPVFKLIHAQSFKTDIMIDHIAMHPSSWYNQNISFDDMSTFTIIVHLQVKSIKTSFITYHVLDRQSMDGYNSNGTPIIKGDKSVTKLLDLVLNCNDKTIQNNRLKLIPRIVEGPYPVKRVVENRPVLLGNKVSQQYYRGSNYFEIDSRVDESMVAASIIKLCHRFAKRIVVDMAWTIQGEELDELPERLLCGVTLHNMEFNKCKDLKYEMANCPKLVYNKKDSKQDDCKQDK